MNKIKKFTLYISSFIILSAGVEVKICEQKSKHFTKNVVEFTSNFTDDNYLVVAHRGFSSKEVENTVKAIELADKTEYVDYIEMDVRLTSDDRLVLSHDNTIFDIDNNIVKISKERYDDICYNEYSYCSFSTYNKLTNIFNDNSDIVSKRNKKLEDTTYTVSSLKDGLNCCNNKKILLDLKFEKNTKEYVNELLNELDNFDTTNIIFQSSDLTSLLYLKQLKPNYNCSAIIKKKSDLEYASLFNKLTIKKNLVNKKLISDLLEEDKKIAVWTVNDPNEIYEIKEELGKDYKQLIYITDYPDVIATCLNNKKAKKHIIKKLKKH